MFARRLESVLRKAQKTHRVVTLVGPRQSGKTTLLKNAFPEAQYHTLESPDIRALALEDPRGFLSPDSNPKLRIIDEIQRAPELLSYIQEIVDHPKSAQRFLLTGSHNLLLMEKVSQSLAGRTRLLTLLPMSYRELNHAGVAPKQLNDAMRYGGYPRIYNEKLDPWEWLGHYYQTYVEKDVRALQNITDLGLFERFMELCAGQVGQLCNLNPDFIKNLNYINQLQSQSGGLCIYGGNNGGKFKDIQRIPWFEI
jgi:hypothetical protein